ncbi:MAG: CRTAC1 family protein [Planctomycetota bacterium]
MLRPLRNLAVPAAAAVAIAGAALAQQPIDPSCCELPAVLLPPLGADATDKETWLRRIHDEAGTHAENLFLSTRHVDELRRQLAALSDSAPVLQRCERRWNLAIGLLRLGRIDDTIRLLDECVAICEQHPEQCRAFLPLALFRLAVAHFRDAEKKNCIANHNADSCILPLSPRAVHTTKEPAAAARGVLERLLALPGHGLKLDAVWLLNLAHMALGTWPDAVPAQYRIPAERFGTEAAIGRFVDVGRELGLARHGHAGSVVLDDFTGDGRLDVLTCKIDTGQALRLCRNDGDGRFTDISEEAGLGRQLGGVNVVQADIDNDGLLDLLVLRGGGFEAQAEMPNSLLRQDRPRHFVDVTKAAGIEVAAPTRTAAFADIDRDGDLDLFVGYDSEQFFAGSETGPAARPKFPSRLWRNDGNGTFTDVTEAAGINNQHHCAGAVFGDVDGDGYPDLFLSNFMARNRLYMNRGDGTFVNDLNARGVGGWRETGPAAFFDQDNDGDLDLFLTACRHILQVSSVAAWYLEGRLEGFKQELFDNDGQGRFQIVTAARGLQRTLTATSLALGDVDNDGTVDLYIGTGTMGIGGDDFAALFPDVLLLNGERFRDVTVNAGVGHLQKCNGVAMGDLDDDGDLDLVLSVGGFWQDDTFRDVVFRNPGNQNHWLSVELQGVRDNRFGVGSRIRVRVAGVGGERDLFQWIGMGASFGCNPLRAHFGLGQAERVLFVEVRWQASGDTQRVEGVPLDAAIRLVQGQAGCERRQRRPGRLGG